MRRINLLLIGLLFISSFVLLPYLPVRLPMHWNVFGEIDSYWPKNIGVWCMPLLVLAMWVGFQIIPNFDPNKKKYQLFEKEWVIMQTGFIVFFTYMQFIIFYTALNPMTDIRPLMFIGLGSLFVLIGNYLSKIRQNYFIGIKVPWTLASEDNWNKTHRFASWVFVIVGLITLIEAYFIWYAPGVIFGGIMLAVFLPIIYSFLLFKKKSETMRYAYLIIVGLILVIGSLRLLSGEDDWVCQEGKWIKHGQPSAIAPQKPCPKQE